MEISIPFFKFCKFAFYRRRLRGKKGISLTKQSSPKEASPFPLYALYSVRRSVFSGCCSFLGWRLVDVWLTFGWRSIGKVSIDKVSIERGKGSAEGKTKRDRFVPPTLEEVKKYCSERNNNVNAERFIDYYTANGWQVGKNKMKDWKATVRSWEKNEYSTPAKSKNGGWCFSPEEDTLDDLF